MLLGVLEQSFENEATLNEKQGKEVVENNILPKHLLVSKIGLKV